MPEPLIWAAAAVLGAATGSFLNVCIHRWPAGESVIAPRSRCPACSAAIAWHDNVPVVSYLLLRGRCRGCSEPISVRYPIIEAATAGLWVAAAIRFGPEIEALRSAVFLSILLGIALIDAAHQIIPDQFSLVGAAIGIAFAAIPGDPSLLDAAVGAGGAYAFMWAIAYGGEKLFRKPALGLGDVHMMAMIGAFLGLPGALLTVLLGSVLGLVIGVPLSWWRGRLSLLGTYLPLGTFLAMGAAVTHAWGDALIDWYFGLVTGAR